MGSGMGSHPVPSGAFGRDLGARGFDPYAKPQPRPFLGSPSGESAESRAANAERSGRIVTADLQLAGGFVEFVGGAFLTLRGTPVGVAVLFHGLDNMASGLATLRGEERTTLTYRYLTDGMGMSPGLAEGSERALELSAASGRGTAFSPAKAPGTLSPVEAIKQSLRAETQFVQGVEKQFVWFEKSPQSQMVAFHNPKTGLIQVTRYQVAENIQGHRLSDAFFEEVLANARAGGRAVTEVRGIPGSSNAEALINPATGMMDPVRIELTPWARSLDRLGFTSKFENGVMVSTPKLPSR